MSSSGVPLGGGRPIPIAVPTESAETPPQLYLLALLHRKWLVITTFLLVSAGTAIVSLYLPNIYSSQTTILVDPQQVPGNYVQPTVTGNIRNRLGTLSEQILSATRLQKIIDTFNLYEKERKKMAREDVISLMRKDITVDVVSEVGSRSDQDLQAFKIGYSGKDPRVTAQVANELASLFIEENLKSREQIAIGTSDFLKNELEGTRKTLEELESKILEFKMAHLGEMPEQQQANIQIFGQLQSRLQELSDSLDRAQQQRSYLQTLEAATQSTIVSPSIKPQEILQPNTNRGVIPPSPSEAKLVELLGRYGENHPDVKRLRIQIEEERRATEKAERVAKEAELQARESASPPTHLQEPLPQVPQQNPIAPNIKAQLAQVDTEIANRKEDQQKLIKAIDSYQKKLEAGPMREQEIATLVRDYAISKEHYSVLLEKQLSANMATQLEIRQQGEKFTILDPAQIPQKPTSPNRRMINLGGIAGGLVLGLALAVAPEILGTSIILPSQIGMAAGMTLLGVIPIITTPYDRRRRKRIIVAGATGGMVMALALCAFLIYHFRDRIF